MKNLNKIGINTAKYSFIIGTLFLLTYAITKYDMIAVFGYYYLITAIFFNIAIVLYLIIKTIINKSELITNLKTIGVILLNIPIAYLYVIIVFDYLNFF